MSAKNYDVQMTPLAHAHQVLDAMAAGGEDIFAGENATDIRDAIHADAKAFERQVSRALSHRAHQYRLMCID